MKKLILPILAAWTFSYGLTLQDAINEAVANNPELKSYNQQIVTSEYQLKADENLQFPTFFASASEKFYNKTPMTKIPNFPVSFKQSNKDFFTFDIGLNQAIYTGGQVKNKIQISKHNLEATKYFYKEMEDEITAQVVKAYLDVFVASALVDVYKKEYQAVESIYKQQQEFFKEGLITKVDLLQSKVRLAEVERSLTEAKGNLKIALARLSKLTGKNIQEDEKFEKPVLSIKEPENYQELLEQALNNRNIISFYKENIKQSQAKAEIEKAQFLPKVFVQGEYLYTTQSPYLDPKGNFVFTAGLQVEFQGVEPYYKYLQAKSNTQKLNYDLENIKENIKLEIKTAYENYITAKQNLKVAEESLSYAKEYFELVKEQYANQLATNTDLLNAESSYTKAYESREINFYNLQKAYVDLMKSAGRLEEVLK
jgi:outer membrane protein TolC